MQCQRLQRVRRLGHKGSTEESEPWMRTVTEQEADPAGCFVQTAEETLWSFKPPFLTTTYIRCTF